MTCFYCKDNMSEGFTTHFAQVGDSFIIIKTFPVSSVSSAVRSFIPLLSPSGLSSLSQSLKKL